MSTDFEDLRQITALLEDQALAKHRIILERDSAVRLELSEIETLRHQSLRQDEHAHARRMLGADGLWQGWLAERRMRLNQDLAMLQVRKADSQAAAQAAFARHQVTEDLVHAQHETARRKRLTLLEIRLDESRQFGEFDSDIL